jgi:DNA-binding response OmpR family regulator
MSRHSKKPSAVARTSRRAHVLIVDDEVDITQLLGRALHRHDIEVTTFNDPEEALKEFRSSKYDLALIDIRMPGMNGFELLKKIKSKDRKIRTCFLTAFEIEKEDFVTNEIPTDSIDCYIKKPVLLPDFVDKVSRILEGV